MTTRFSDDFDGTALDTAKWNTSLATSGVRWCPSTQANHLSVSGLWQDVGALSCHGRPLVAPPHGSIVVSNGTATFSAGTRYTFPYVWRGQPSATSPFPGTGAFVLEVRMKFNSLAVNGTEFHVGDWPNTDPVGDNPPGNLVLSIGACNSCGVVTNLLGATGAVSGSTAYHDYRLEYVNGRYSLWVDGVRTMGPVASAIRPNAIWMGNPVDTWWQPTPNDWTDFTMDSVQVSSESAATHLLDVTNAGNGGGTVTSTPSGINCGPTCSASFDDGTQVTLSSVADANSSFAGWSGAGCPVTGDCVLTMDQARSVTATFTKNTYQLDVSKAGTGGGTITSTPSGINCGPTCSASFDAGAPVTVSVTPNANSTFMGWSGSGCSGTGDCVVAMVQARSIAATFSTSRFPLDISKTGTGGGIVSSTPAGIDCSSTCSASFDDGSQVTLTAIPAPGSGFQGWGGDCAGLGTCTVSMGGARFVTATFDAVPPGQPWAWGYNHFGQVGDGSFVDRTARVQVAGGLSNVIAVSAGGGNSLALRSDGTVWSWGGYGSGSLGHDFCTDPPPACATPVLVAGLTNIVAISAGDSSSLALRSDGTVWAWGYNADGRVGNAACIHNSVISYGSPSIVGSHSIRAPLRRGSTPRSRVSTLQPTPCWTWRSWSVPAAPMELESCSRVEAGIGQDRTAGVHAQVGVGLLHGLRVAVEVEDVGQPVPVPGNPGVEHLACPARCRSRPAWGRWPRRGRSRWRPSPHRPAR